MVKYRKASSLRDEIGTCLNIEVELQVTDKSHFFIRPFHDKEDKPMIDDLMQSLVHVGILKTGYVSIFFSHNAYC